MSTTPSYETAPIWDQRYAARIINHALHYDHWLERWKHVLLSQPGQALDLGCGIGLDSVFLGSLGFTVVALDQSRTALEEARRLNPKARVLHGDLRQFREKAPGPFQVIVASLSLHYFPREDTQALFAAVHASLAKHGILAFRVNAKEEVDPDNTLPDDSWELLIRDEIPRQFFTEEKIRELLGSHFELRSIEKRITTRYGNIKSVYEVLAFKSKSENPSIPALQ